MEGHSQTSEDLLTPLKLDQMRRQGDPEADALVQELYTRGNDCVIAFNQAMRSLEKGKDWLCSRSRKGLPASVVDFLAQGRDVGKARGGWDESRLHNGTRVHRHYSLHTSLVLQLATMPYLYAARNAMKVLVATKRLKDDALRRSIETAQMFFDVMHPHCFTAEGHGWRTCQKVRLLHAAVRYMILSSGRWDTETWGVPINQEDMVGTLYGFSILVLDGLKQLGAKLSDSDCEDFYYRWQAIGEWMGINPSYIAKDVTTARNNQILLVSHQFGASTEGHTLIDSWIEAMKEMAPLERMKPYASAAIECMVGPQVAQLLGLHSTTEERNTAQHMLRRLGPPDQLLRRGSLRRKAYDLGMYAGLMFLFLKGRGRQRPSFALPVRKR